MDSLFLLFSKNYLHGIWNKHGNNRLKEMLNLGISGGVSVEEVSLQLCLPQGLLTHRTEVVRLVRLPNLIISLVYEVK